MISFRFFLIILTWNCFIFTHSLPLLEAEETKAGFKPIFDGKTLKNWEGDLKYWKVENGSITGWTTTELPLKKATYLIWRGGEVADFELKLEYRIESGNSGIQYRSSEFPDEKWRLRGYQADIDVANKYTGILYGAYTRQFLAWQGEKVVISRAGKPKVIESIGNAKTIKQNIKTNDWNRFHIIARGNHLIHKINGQTIIDAVDNDIEEPHLRSLKGLLGFQLHQGPPMKVQFRNLRLKQFLQAKPKSK